MSKSLKNSLLLLLTSIIWGFAFAVQSKGGESLDVFSFFAFRNYFAVLMMLILIIFLYKKDEKYDIKRSVIFGLICGVIECTASLFQQDALIYTTAANVSFITTLYVILVPIFGVFLGEKINKKTWLCVVLVVIGMYLLCIKPGFTINKGDALALLCGILFAIHILVIDRGGESVNSLIFCFVQFFVCGFVSTILMLIFETPINFTGVKEALVPLAYTGMLSSAVAVTLQVKAQKELNPTIASIIMCTESVFGAIGGWLILHEVLSTKELIGCFIMFVAILLSQVNIKRKKTNE